MYLHGARRRRGPRAARRRRAARLGPARRDRDRPQAAGGDRRAQAAGGRLGLQARVGGARPADRRPSGPPTRRRPPGAPGPGASEPIEERLARGGPAAAAADRLARDRPRRACRQPRRAPRARRPGRRRSSRSSRPTPTATGRSRSRGRSRRPAPTGCASRRSTRRWRCATRRHRALPILVLYPIPALAGAAARSERRGHGRRPRARSRRCSARRRGRRRRPPLDVQLEVETGLGRGGVRGRGRSWSRPRGDRRRAGASPAGVWTHLQAPEDAARTAAPGRAVRGRARRRSRRPGSRCRAATSPRAAASCLGGASRLRRRPAGARDSTASCPDELVPATLGRRAVAELRPVLSLRARPGPGRGPAGRLGGSATARRSRPAGRAGSRRCRSGYGDGWPRSLSNRAEALVRGVRVPLVGNVAMDAVHGRRHRRARSAGRGRRRVRAASASQGDERITAADLARARTTNSWEVVTSMSRRVPRVYDAAAGARGLRTLISEGGFLARIELWNGDICDLEVDAIVNAANLSLWMATGVGGAIKRAGGDSIEFAAVRQAPVPIGERDRHAGRRPRRPVRDPRRLARPRPPDERLDHRRGRSERVRPGPREQRRRASRSRPSGRASAGSRSTRPRW